ncbi:MAG: hypothetical protein Q9174_004975, partial [Haloplaca sp. 1 TL-2023]
PDFHLNGTPGKLPLLHAVCNEVLRVHPPVGLTLREAAVNTSIQGQYIPAGTKIIMAPAATNISTKLWGPDAKAWKPGRWLEAGQTNSGGAASNYSFLTFLHGPRSCIGQQFARAEFAALLAAMIGRFETELAEPEKGINIQAGLTSRPEGGLPSPTSGCYNDTGVSRPDEAKIPHADTRLAERRMSAASCPSRESGQAIVLQRRQLGRKPVMTLEIIIERRCRHLGSDVSEDPSPAKLQKKDANTDVTSAGPVITMTNAGKVTTDKPLNAHERRAEEWKLAMGHVKKCRPELFNLDAEKTMTPGEVQKRNAERKRLGKILCGDTATKIAELQRLWGAEGAEQRAKSGMQPVPVLVTKDTPMDTNQYLGRGMPPPAKRRKRLVVLSSEDEEEKQRPSNQEEGPGSRKLRRPRNATPNNTCVLPTRLRSDLSTVRPRARAPSAPGVSPKKGASRNKPIAPRKDLKPSSLDNYLSTANGIHRSTNPASQSQSPRVAVEDEDLIEDDSFDEELRKLTDPGRGIRDGGKEALSQSQSQAENKGASGLLAGSQMFRGLGNRTAEAKKTKEASPSVGDDSRPWADRYGPTSIEELAVHKKKVVDVRDGLQKVLEGRSKKRLLILKGASGVGKTATLSTLALDMGFEVMEWTNPAVSDFSTGNYVSTFSQFEDFLERSGKFSSLQVGGKTDGDGVRDPPTSANHDSASSKKVILVEEFPNVFTSSSNALQSFRSTMLRYLTASQKVSPLSSKSNASIPLVLIITETASTNTTSLSDAFSAHSLLGPSILTHPSTTIIEFNPIAPTFITKALNLVLQKEARHSGRRRIPSPSVLKQLSEVGDVRSAIGSLEFLCLRGRDQDDWGGRVASKGKKGVKTAAAMTDMERRSLELVTQREASLGLFHAVGKVVYNKREDDRLPDDPPTQPSEHLPQHVRLKHPGVVADELVDETGTDTQTFIAALHENYVLSCSGSGFIDSFNACIEHLSDSDILISGERAGRHRGVGQAAESARQDELAFHVTVRGLLFSLPFPVQRAVGIGANKGGMRDTFKMFYPTSMRLGRMMQEVRDELESWERRSRGGVGPSLGHQGEGEYDSVLHWARRTLLPDEGGEDGAGNGPCSSQSKDTMVLE